MRLNASKSVNWNEPTTPPGVRMDRVFIGPDPFGLGGIQVAVGQADRAPSRQSLRDLFAARRGKTQLQLVVAVVHRSTAHLFGPDPLAQPVELPTEQAQRQLQSVLDEPDVLAATERIAGFRKAHDSTAASGFTNSGLFATHHLTKNLPQRPDWEHLNQTGAAMLTARGQALIDALGFRTQPAAGGAVLLSTPTDASRAVAVLLDDTEQFDSKSSRFQLSPVAYGLAVASQQEVPWLVVLRKDQIRLYPGRDGVGVGSKGQAETYFEIDLSTVDATFAGLLPLIFTADALASDGTTDQLLDESTRYATELGERLRERIYDEIIPPLAVEVTHQLAENAQLRLDTDGLATAYRVTLRILFRLLFQAYAEDRGLLPSGRNEGFDANSLKTNAQRLIAVEDDEFGDATTLWRDLTQVWDAIDKGNAQWQIPAYNGGLFSSDPERSADGALFTKIQIPDRALGPALKHLLIDTTSDGIDGPVDFRSLSVREFGTIYEGLLESSLSKAEQDLALDGDGAWVPAKQGASVHVRAGGVYFHSASGERKATGSYFTPKPIVDHLIERSVVPALTAHLDKIAGHLAKGDAAAAARDFFDFRVADLAMGSGHFLVAAVDKIEALMRTFLAQHVVPGVTDELIQLRDAAREALGSDDVAKSEVDEIGLLRRQVARRCIYGLDINPMAVELARLALWIHTFVPGLPMSNLDHGLVNANSLTGVASVEEAVDALAGLSETFAGPIPQDGSDTIADGALPFDDPAAQVDPQQVPRPITGYQSWLVGVLRQYLEEARPILLDVAGATEATMKQVQETATLLNRAREAAEPARRIFDAAVVARLDDSGALPKITRPEHLERLTKTPTVSQAAAPLMPGHLPYLFPEVFIRTDPGFDVVIGNPPWDKVRWEPAPYWARVRPGLMALPDAERDARIAQLRTERPVEAAREAIEMEERHRLQGYYKKAFSWRGGTHLELAQLMMERALRVTRLRGYTALVLPRQSLVLAGWKRLRQVVLNRNTVELVQARNKAEWMFEGVHSSYAVVLLTASPLSEEPISVRVVTSNEELRAAVGHEHLVRISSEELTESSDTMVVPWFTTPRDRAVFDKLRRFPRLAGPGGWVTGVHDARWDFRASGPDKSLRTEVQTPNSWAVMMTRHLDAYSIRDAPAKQFLNDWQAIAAKAKGIEADDHRGPRFTTAHPMVLVRHPSRSDDTRTLIASALPAEGWVHNKGYVHAVAHVGGTSPTELLALLALLNTNTEDWWARRFVDRHVTAPVINNLPLPALAPAAIRELAQRAAVILARNGYTKLAGGIDVEMIARTSTYARDTSEKLLAQIEAVVAKGFGLTAGDMELISSDFSEKGMSRALFNAVIDHLTVGAPPTETQ